MNLAGRKSSRILILSELECGDLLTFSKDPEREATRGKSRGTGVISEIKKRKAARGVAVEPEGEASLLREERVLMSERRRREQ